MIIKRKDPILYNTNDKDYNVTRQWWLTYLHWNVYLNYEVPNSNTIVIVYNWSVAAESYRLRRPLYLPCKAGNAKVLIEIES